jgi:hypothetical protein
MSYFFSHATIEKATNSKNSWTSFPSLDATLRSTPCWFTCKCLGPNSLPAGQVRCFGWYFASRECCSLNVKKLCNERFSRGLTNHLRRLIGGTFWARRGTLWVTSGTVLEASYYVSDEGLVPPFHTGNRNALSFTLLDRAWTEERVTYFWHVS